MFLFQMPMFNPQYAAAYQHPQMVPGFPQMMQAQQIQQMQQMQAPGFVPPYPMHMVNPQVAYPTQQHPQQHQQQFVSPPPPVISNSIERQGLDYAKLLD